MKTIVIYCDDCKTFDFNSTIKAEGPRLKLNRLSQAPFEVTDKMVDSKNINLISSELYLILYSLTVIYVVSNNSEYFGGEFSISIFLLVSMLGFDSVDAGVDKTYFHCGNKHFQIAAKHMNKADRTTCKATTLPTLFISSIEFQGVWIMIVTK